MGHLTRIANTIVHNLEKGPVHTQINTLITGVCERKRAAAKEFQSTKVLFSLWVQSYQRTAEGAG